MTAKSPSQHPRQVLALQHMLRHVHNQDSGLLPPCCMAHCSDGKALLASALLSLLVTRQMAVVYRLQWYTQDCESKGMLAERALSADIVHNRMQ